LDAGRASENDISLSGLGLGREAPAPVDNLPPETVSDLASTYLKDDESIADTNAVCRATLRTLALIGTYLEKLDERTEGGFEPDWYRRMLDLMEEDLSRF
jgi:hypothetical protein